MDIRLILTDKAYEGDAHLARLFLNIFGIKWTQEIRKVDISDKALYETKSSSDGKIKTSLKTSWILSLAKERCVALVAPKKGSHQKGLNGQQGTQGTRYAIEVYVDNRKGEGLLSGTAATIVHEIMHALAEYFDVADTLHIDLKTKTLEQCREILLDRILKKDNPWGLLPTVARMAEKMLTEYSPIKILEGYRSPERQDELYNQKPKVTNAKAWQSMHQYRVAFDYCFMGKVPFPPSGDPKWNAVNVYARSIGLYSYGIDENFDDGHLELLLDYSEKQVMGRNIDWTRFWSPTPSVSPKFDRDLMKGSKGEDVLVLQRFLNSEGFTLAKEGAGSPGKETQYFGELTRAALARYQKANGISPAEGYLGLITRRHIS